jgi:exopolyphosphatase/pppGpp-phosphohydrolase
MMSDEQASICAAIDIGSNTIHVVVARCFPHRLDILADEQELVRIGESVTATGEISAEKRTASIATLHKYQELAAQYHAEAVLVVATEAIRQAKNGEEFLSDLRQATGLRISLIDGAAEATLTFYGATYEVLGKADGPELLGVMDLGGGSTELVIARDEHVLWSISVPVGSGWLHDRYFHADPPTRTDLAVAHTFLDTYFRGLAIKLRPDVLLATGGSANSLLFLARAAFNLPSEQSVIGYDDLLHCQGLLDAFSAEEIAQRYNVAMARARILPAGALIIQTVMDCLQVRELHVSSHGIREGCLLAYARYGEQWLQRVRQEGQSVNSPKTIGNGEQAPSFLQLGRSMLQERLDKMLEWRSEVLKQQDIEAVHKMRVASRRLRAVLDAYQSVCDARAFNKVYRQVKDLADMLGEARDTDVMLEHLSQMCALAGQSEQAGLVWLIDHLRSYRQQHQRQLEAFLQQLDDDALRKQVRLCLPEISSGRNKDAH